MSRYVNGKQIDEPSRDNNYIINCIPPRVEEKGAKIAGQTGSRIPVELTEMSIKVETNTPEQENQRKARLREKMGKQEEREF